MGRGGWREGAGRKKKGTNPAAKPTTRPPLRAEPKLKAAPPLAASPPPVPAEPKLPAAIDPRALAAMLPEIEEISKRYAQAKYRTPETNPFRIPWFPKAAKPAGAEMAMDSMPGFSDASSAWLAGSTIQGIAAEGLLFLGYPYLSELAQRPEYRTFSETIADDATRRWIDFDVVGDEKKQEEERKKDPMGYDRRMADPDERKKRVAAAGKTDKVKMLRDDQLRLDVQTKIYEQCRNDGFFGRSHLYCDIWTTGTAEPSDQELTTPLGDPRDPSTRGKIPKGSFKALRTIEPVWTYPLMYNAINPLKEDWYNPQTWYVMGKQIHGSRIPTFIGRPVPDLLKPAYAFGGLSLTQLAKPYVDIWLTTRESIGNLIHSFSVMVLMTDLSTLMQPQNVSALMARVAMFNMLRDNQGTFVVNKNTEDFKNVSASLAGLHELQSQAQEHMFSVVRIPLVKGTGISPAGLNASSEGEIAVYDDTIEAYQGRFIRPNLDRVICYQHWSLFGEFDPEITWRFEKLRVMTEKEKAEMQKHDAERDDIYVGMGALDPAEVRTRIVNDPDLPYTGLNAEDVPELPDNDMPPGAGGAAEVPGPQDDDSGAE